MKLLSIGEKILYTCLITGALAITHVKGTNLPQAESPQRAQTFWAQTKSIFSHTTDFIAQKILISTAIMWFEGLPKSEQERIILESSYESFAHKKFEELYGKHEYVKILNKKNTYVLLHEQHDSLAQALILWAHVTHQPPFSRPNNHFIPGENSHDIELQTDSGGIQPYANAKTTCLFQTSPNKYFETTSRQALDNYAITQGIGYKTANLNVLQKLCQSSELQNLPGGITIKVPEFVGVSDNQIKSFLKKNNLDVADSWNALIQEILAVDIKNFVVTPDFIQRLELLANRIQKIFDTAATQIESKSTTLNELGFDQKLEELIALCMKQKAFITTRSTGREDTEELANAGGNTSNEIVRAHAADVLRGMGTVVSSYFRAKSFGQRALLQDTKLYDVPLMPVLIQRVVAETDGSLFCGCVSYTREPQGNVPGISISQCTHGHTKGVVDSLVALDTIICKKTRCHLIVKKKPIRIAPVLNDKTFALDFIDNDDYSANKPSLTPEQQKALARVLEFIEQAYGKPMDLELSFDHDNNILYLYQARPLVVKVSDQPPSYVNDDSQLGTGLECTTMSQAGGSLRLISNRNRIIITPTLDDALNEYLTQRTINNKFDFDLVIVQKDADATSHAAATFNGMSKPVMVTHDYEKLQEYVTQENFEILIDVQKSKIYALHTTQFKNKTLKQLKADGLIKDGLSGYPLPHILSIPEGNSLSEKIEFYAAFPEQAPHVPLGALLENLKSAKQHQAIFSINTIMSRLAKLITIKQQQITCSNNKFFNCSSPLEFNCPLLEVINNTCFTQKPAHQALEKLNNLFVLALEIYADIINQLDCKAYDLKRLFPIALLETLLFQKQNNDIINSYSYSSVLEKYHSTVAFIKNKIMPLIEDKTMSVDFLNNQELLTLAQAGTDASFTSDIENKWITFLANAAQQFTGEHQEMLKNMLNDITNLNMLSAWINTRFASQHGSPQETFSQLLVEYLQDQAFLKQLKTSKENLGRIDPIAWQESSNFEQLKNAFDIQLFTWFTCDELEKIIKNPDQHPFAYQAAVSTMNTFVGTFDQIIKSIKSTPETKIDNQVRATNFKTMIGKYLELLEKWSTVIPNNIIQYHEKWPLEKYLFELKRIFNETVATNAELFPSPGFNVNAAALGSAAAFNRFNLTTLEDLFTTIHQSLLIIINSLSATNFIAESALPLEFRKNAELLDTWTDGEIKSYRTGIIFNNQTLSYLYNIPLQNHSMALVLSYSKATDHIDISFQFFGIEIKRWQIMNIYAQLTAKIYSLSLKNIQLNEKGTSFTLSHNSLIDLSQILIDMVSITYGLYDIAFYEIFDEGSAALELVNFIAVALQDQDSLTRSTGLLALDRLLHKIPIVDLPLENKIVDQLHSAISFLLQQDNTNLRSSGALALEACIKNIERFDISIQNNMAERFSMLQNMLSEEKN